MWVERFDWWGQDERVIQFAEYILEQPDDLSINPETDITILGNVCAFWTGARARLFGYESRVVEDAQALLSRLPPLVDCTAEQALARARLLTAIGYQYRLGGMLGRAAAHSVDAKAAFRKMGKEHLIIYREEYSLLLSSLAFTYAEQGRMVLARPLAHDALRINEEMGNEYGKGLTLITLSKIARIRGSYSKALTYSDEALDIFRELGDARGTALAYQGIACAKRWMAKHELEKGRKLEKIYLVFEDARLLLEKAVRETEEAGIGSLISDLYAEQGRVYRELGRTASLLGKAREGTKHYRQSERQLRLAMEGTGQGKISQADTLQDLAEVLFSLDDDAVAQDCLARVEELMGHEYHIIPGEQMPQAGLPRENFAPLGKVELTRGQIAFDEGQLEKGVQHFVLAYAYFVRFSPQAVELDTMIEYLYNHLRDLHVDRQQQALESVRAWVDQYDLSVDVSVFLQTLGDLLGV